MSGALIIDADPWHLVGQEVTLAGIARDAAEGAMVLLKDRTPVYVHGLYSWDDKLDRKSIVVTGTLRLAGGSEPLVNAAGEHASGSDGERLELVNASWKAAD